MSDTPKTDEIWGSMHGSGYQMMLLCQKLERELAEAKRVTFDPAVLEKMNALEARALAAEFVKQMSEYRNSVQRDMKPDAWRDQTYGNLHNQDWGGATPLYSAATIRKWLLERPNDQMWYTGMNTDGGTDDKYIAMIALKLEELK